MKLYSDVLFIDIVAQECKDVDIYGTNTYRGVNFTDLFDVVRENLDMPVMLTDDETGARALIDEKLALYSNIPSYRAMLNREGANGPGDVAMVGSANSLREQIAQLAEIGVTDLNAVLVHETQEQYQRTLDFLAGELTGVAYQ